MSNETKHFDLELFYQKTDGGLLFWEQEFCNEKIKKTTKGFSFDGGSSNVTKNKAGKYLFTNFKEFNKGIDVLGYVINRDTTDFIGACNTLFAQFQLDTTSVAKPLHLPVKNWLDTTEEVGKYEIEYFPATKKHGYFCTIFN